MENTNEDLQEDVVEGEEQTSEEVELEETQEDTQEDDSEITLSKEEFTKLKRKAIAYDSNKSKPKETAQPVQKADRSEDDYIEEVFAIKDLSREEYEKVKEEANELGVPFKKLLASNAGKNLLDKVRAEKKSKDSMENLSSKSPVYKKFTQTDLSKMSSAELEKILPHE